MAWFRRFFGLHPGRRGWPLFRWHNWAGNRRCTATRYFEPRSKEQIAKIVREARAEGVHVRVIGNSYSWSKLIPTQDYLICLKRMNRLIDIDPNKQTVTVECGMSLGTLTNWVTRAGMSVQSPTVIPFLSVGGVLAIGAHGSSTQAGPLPDQAITFSYVTAEGEFGEVTDKDERRIRAMRTSLGALGVVYQVKIQCQKDFHMHVKNYLHPLEDTLNELPQLVAKNEFVDIFLFPYTDQAWLKIANRTRKPSNLSTWKKFRHWLAEILVERIIAGPCLWVITRFFVRQTPWFMNFQLKINPEVHYDVIEDSSIALHYNKYYPKCLDFSYAVNHEDAPELWRHYVKKLDEYAKQGKYPLNMVLHSRFIRRSETYLSPAVGRDMTAYVEMVTYKTTPGYEEFYRDVEKGVLDKFPGARPHWGKLYYEPERIKKNYVVDGVSYMDEFLAVRDQMDPDGVFLNDFLRDSIFQLPNESRR